VDQAKRIHRFYSWDISEIPWGSSALNPDQITPLDSLPNGYYKFKATALEYTLIPQKFGYEFLPASFPIPANSDNQTNINFGSQKLTMVTISGNVTWKNISDVTTIQSNPLPGDNNLTIPAIAVAMEACPQDGSPCSRIVADVDGKYSIPVPFNWSGSVKPSSLGFEFNPEKITYSGLKVNKTLQNYQAPLSPGGSVYKITVSVKRPGGALLPPSEKFIIWFNGINHANGSKVYCQKAKSLINSRAALSNLSWKFL